MADPRPLFTGDEMSIDIIDGATGKLIHSSDPAKNPGPPRAVRMVRQRDVPMIALRKFRAPGTGGTVWPGDPFDLYQGEVDHFERFGLAKRKPVDVTPEPVVGDAAAEPEPEPEEEAPQADDEQPEP